MIPADVPRISLQSADGATAAVTPDGAHVVSWIPAGERDDWLFVSTRSQFGTGNAVRGGIPVIFPQFGVFGPLAQHGFARRQRWTPMDDTGLADRVRLRLSDDAESRAVWPSAFQLEVAVHVTGRLLEVAMTVTNVDDVPFAFTAAFHPYFAVRSAFESRVEGLRGCTYRDSLRAGQQFTETAASLDIVGPLDRIYYDAPDRLVMVDGDRSVVIEKSGFPEAVVWNPGVEGTRSRTDFADGEEQRMLCVEAALIQTPRTLAPGESWTGIQCMTALSRE
jgi:glucose-6-phosphate 1-epimerase